MTRFIFTIILLCLGFTFTNVYGHTVEIVEGYKLEIGWINEPPLVGEKNGFELFVTIPVEQDLQPSHHNHTNVNSTSTSTMHDHVLTEHNNTTTKHDPALTEHNHSAHSTLDCTINGLIQRIYNKDVYIQIHTDADNNPNTNTGPGDLYTPGEVRGQLNYIYGSKIFTAYANPYNQVHDNPLDSILWAKSRATATATFELISPKELHYTVSGKNLQNIVGIYLHKGDQYENSHVILADLMKNKHHSLQLNPGSTSGTLTDDDLCPSSIHTHQSNIVTNEISSDIVEMSSYHKLELEEQLIYEILQKWENKEYSDHKAIREIQLILHETKYTYIDPKSQQLLDSLVDSAVSNKNTYFDSLAKIQYFLNKKIEDLNNLPTTIEPETQQTSTISVPVSGLADKLEITVKLPNTKTFLILKEDQNIRGKYMGYFTPLDEGYPIVDVFIGMIGNNEVRVTFHPEKVAK